MHVTICIEYTVYIKKTLQEEVKIIEKLYFFKLERKRPFEHMGVCKLLVNPKLLNIHRIINLDSNVF